MKSNGKHWTLLPSIPKAHEAAALVNTKKVLDAFAKFQWPILP